VRPLVDSTALLQSRALTVAVSAISMLVTLQSLAVQTLQTFATPSLSSGKHFRSLILLLLFLPEQVGS